MDYTQCYISFNKVAVDLAKREDWDGSLPSSNGVALCLAHMQSSIETSAGFKNNKFTKEQVEACLEELRKAGVDTTYMQ